MTEERRPRATEWIEAIRGELALNWENDVAIALGALVGLLGILQITSLTVTVSLVLVALGAVAGSLRRDRGLREKLAQKVENLDSRIGLISRALSSPLPYEVVKGHYRWDFEDGGRLASVNKRARLHFVHNGVWTILQWRSEDVEVRDATARYTTEQGQRHELDVLAGPVDPPEHRVGRLVALDQECHQGDIIDFEYGYRSYENFNASREWIKIDIETSTDELTIELVWAQDRWPRSIWRMEDGERIPLSTEPVERRHRTQLSLQRLTRGQKVRLEWDWLSLQDLESKGKKG